MNKQHQNSQTIPAGTSLGYSHRAGNANCQPASSRNGLAVSWFYVPAGTGLCRGRLCWRLCITGQIVWGKMQPPVNRRKRPEGFFFLLSFFFFYLNSNWNFAEDSTNGSFGIISSSPSSKVVKIQLPHGMCQRWEEGGGAVFQVTRSAPLLWWHYGGSDRTIARLLSSSNRVLIKRASRGEVRSRFGL